MSQSQRSHHRWEFRRRDGHFHSSCDGPVSTSSREPFLKKHKTVPSTSALKLKGGYDSPLLGKKLRVKESCKMKIEMNEDNPKDNGTNIESKGCEPATLVDTRILMASILEELKVARENMLMRMREEMNKMMDEDPTPKSTRRNYIDKHERIAKRHQKSLSSASEVWNGNSGTLDGSVKCKRAISPSTTNEVLKNQDTLCLPALPPVELHGDFLTSSIKQSSYSISPDQVGSSVYLNLPTLLPEAHITDKRFSSCNYFPTRAADKSMTPDTGKVNATLDAHACSIISPACQNEEKFQDTNYVSSPNLVYIGESKLIPSSIFGSGFPVPFRHGFKIQAQECIQNLSQFEDNISGMTMTRGMRAVADDHSLSELYARNNLSNHATYKDNLDAWAQDNLIPSSQKGLVMQELLYQV